MEMARISMSSCAMGEKECGGDGDDVECDYHEVRAVAMLRWSRSESRIKEVHNGEGSVGTCGRTCMQGRPSRIACPRKVGTSLISSCPTSRPSCTTSLWVDKHGAVLCGCTSMVGSCNTVWRRRMAPNENLRQI